MLSSSRATTIAVATDGRAITIKRTIQKKNNEPIYKTDIKLEEKRSDIYYYRKVRRMIIIWGVREKSLLFLSQY